MARTGRRTDTGGARSGYARGRIDESTHGSAVATLAPGSGARDGAADAHPARRDDHAVVRSGLRLVLDAEPDMQVVAEAADGLEARAIALRDEVDLVCSTSPCRD